MRFLLLLTQVEEAWEHAPEGAGERVYQQYMQVEEDLRAQNKLLDSLRLKSTSEAKTLRNLPDERRTHAQLRSRLDRDQAPVG